MTNVFLEALHSIWGFCQLVASGSLHLSRQHLNQTYKSINDQIYAVFRETVSDKNYEGPEVTLIISFRLKVIRGNRTCHWLFQRLCLLDTPVWVGFPGFKLKYWMVDPLTKNYLGMYRYQGVENAKRYARYICAVLRPVSTLGSVEYQIINENFDRFASQHKM